MQAAKLVLKPDLVLAPVLAIGNQLELLLEKRMVRMCYSETSNFNIAMRCSRTLIPMGLQSGGWRVPIVIC